MQDAKKAIGILQPIFQENPDHPGGAHYLIHAADSPELAQMGLEAARQYAQIAPAAPQALHMPSHIFARLGLWQEDIQSNLASLEAARNPSAVHVGAENQLHAMEFLEYANLQIGEDAETEKMVRARRRLVTRKSTRTYTTLSTALAPTPRHYMISKPGIGKPQKLSSPTQTPRLTTRQLPGGRKPWRPATCATAPPPSVP